MTKIKFILFLLLIICISCKKDTKINSSIPTNSSNLRSKFKDTLVTYSTNNSNQPFASYCNASNSFYIVQKSAGTQFYLYKCDQEINLIYSKIINLGSDSLMEIKASNQEDAFYTLTGTNNFNNSNPFYINAYVFNINSDSINNCTPKVADYVYQNAFNANGENKGANYSILNKFDGQGNLLWAKQLDGNYNKQHSIETDVNGNIYVLAANRYPFRPKLNSAYTTSLAPYYDFVNDSNSFSIYKFDISGNQIFKRTITNIKETIQRQFSPALSLSKSNILITNFNNFFVFDLNGNLLSQNKPISNICYNYINNAITNPYIDNIFINGILNYSNSNSSNNLGYLAKLKGSIPLIVTQSNNLYYNFSIIDNLQSIYLADDFTNFLTKIDNNANIVYANKPLFDAPYYFGLPKKSTIVDVNNSLYSFVNRLNGIAVYKFDSNGNFN